MNGGMTMGPILQNIVPDACRWHSHFRPFPFEPFELGNRRGLVYLESTPS